MYKLKKNSGFINVQSFSYFLSFGPPLSFVTKIIQTLDVELGTLRQRWRNNINIIRVGTSMQSFLFVWDHFFLKVKDSIFHCWLKRLEGHNLKWFIVLLHQNTRKEYLLKWTTSKQIQSTIFKVKSFSFGDGLEGY